VLVLDARALADLLARGEPLLEPLPALLDDRLLRGIGIEVEALRERQVEGGLEVPGRPGDLRLRVVVARAALVAAGLAAGLLELLGGRVERRHRLAHLAVVALDDGQLDLRLGAALPGLLGGALLPLLLLRADRALADD